MHFFRGGEGGQGGYAVKRILTNYAIKRNHIPRFQISRSDRMRIQISKFKLSDPVVRLTSKFMYRAFHTWRIDCEYSRSPVTTPSYCSSIRILNMCMYFRNLCSHCPISFKIDLQGISHMANRLPTLASACDNSFLLF